MCDLDLYNWMIDIEIIHDKITKMKGFRRSEGLWNMYINQPDLFALNYVDNFKREIPFSVFWFKNNYTTNPLQYHALNVSF